jgi:hypothetical protein
MKSCELIIDERNNLENSYNNRFDTADDDDETGDDSLSDLW